MQSLLFTEPSWKSPVSSSNMACSDTSSPAGLQTRKTKKASFASVAKPAKRRRGPFDRAGYIEVYLWAMWQLMRSEVDMYNTIAWFCRRHVRFLNPDYVTGWEVRPAVLRWESVQGYTISICCHRSCAYQGSWCFTKIHGYSVFRGFLSKSLVLVTSH